MGQDAEREAGRRPPRSSASHRARDRKVAAAPRRVGGAWSAGQAGAIRGGTANRQARAGQDSGQPRGRQPGGRHGHRQMAHRLPGRPAGHRPPHPRNTASATAQAGGVEARVATSGAGQRRGARGSRGARPARRASHRQPAARTPAGDCSLPWPGDRPAGRPAPPSGAARSGAILAQRRQPQQPRPGRLAPPPAPARRRPARGARAPDARPAARARPAGRAGATTSAPAALAQPPRRADTDAGEGPRSARRRRSRAACWAADAGAGKSRAPPTPARATHPDASARSTARSRGTRRTGRTAACRRPARAPGYAPPDHARPPRSAGRPADGPAVPAAVSAGLGVIVSAPMPAGAVHRRCAARPARRRSGPRSPHSALIQPMRQIMPGQADRGRGQEQKQRKSHRRRLMRRSAAGSGGVAALGPNRAASGDAAPGALAAARQAPGV